MKKINIKEATGSDNSGKFKVPIVLAPEVWKEKELAPFVNSVGMILTKVNNT